MPIDGRDLIADGLRHERTGALERAVELYSEAAQRATEPGVRAEALTRQADAHRALSEWPAALEAARRARRTAATAGLPLDEAHAAVAEANVLMCQGEFDAAIPLFQQVLDGAVADAKLRGIALQNLGSMWAQRGQLGAAERAFAESHGCFRTAGYARGEAIALNNQGRVSLDRGRAEVAAGLLLLAQQAARAVEDHDLANLAMMNRAEALAHGGEHDEAEQLASTALGYYTTAGNRWRQIEALRLLGNVNAARGHVEEARRCYHKGLDIAVEIANLVEATTMRDCLRRLPGG